jgi:hypothetical protein
LQHYGPERITLIEIKHQAMSIADVRLQPFFHATLEVQPKFHGIAKLYAEADTPTPVTPGSGLTDLYELVV